MTYSMTFHATRDRKNPCNLVLESPFKATVTIRSTNKRIAEILKARVLTRQSILSEEDGPEKDFKCEVTGPNSLTIIGNLELFSIYLHQCELVDSAGQIKFVSELALLIKNSELSTKQQKQLADYQANINKANEVTDSEEPPEPQF